MECDVAQDAGLVVEFRPVLVGSEGIVVEAVAVDIVGIDLIDILVVSGFEVPASCRFWVDVAGAAVVGDEIDVDEVVIDHELNAALLQFSVLETHYSVAHHDPLHVYLLATASVVVVDQHRQVGNVLPSIGFPGNPERIVGKLRESCEECLKRSQVVSGCGDVAVLEFIVCVHRVAHSCGRLDEKQMREGVPGIGIGNQLVARLVPRSLLQVERTDFLQEA